MEQQNFSNKLIQLRKMKNLSQQELADLISVSKKTIYRWEKGQTVPDETFLNRIIEVLKIDESYFKEEPRSEEYLEEIVVEPTMKKKGKLSFYRIWFISLVSLLILIALVFLGMYIYNQIIIGSLHNGTSRFTFNPYELIIYVTVIVLGFLVPVLIYEIRRIYIHVVNKKRRTQ